MTFRHFTGIWIVSFVALLTALGMFVVLFLSPPSRRESAVWVEVSRGAWLRAVRHQPTGRCFVRTSGGGLVETVSAVCGESRR
jgi:hypothetical protein